MQLAYEHTAGWQTARAGAGPRLRSREGVGATSWGWGGEALYSGDGFAVGACPPRFLSLLCSWLLSTAFATGRALVRVPLGFVPGPRSGSPVWPSPPRGRVSASPGPGTEAVLFAE